VRVRQVPHRALVNRAAQRLGRTASIPRAELRSSSPGALGKGSRRHGVCRRRYHCPVPGCPLNRSRRCTRPRVPPSASLCSRSCGCHFSKAMRPWRTPDQSLRPFASRLMTLLSMMSLLGGAAFCRHQRSPREKSQGGGNPVYGDRGGNRPDTQEGWNWRGSGAASAHVSAQVQSRREAARPAGRSQSRHAPRSGESSMRSGRSRPRFSSIARRSHRQAQAIRNGRKNGLVDCKVLKGRALVALKGQWSEYRCD